MRWAMSYHRAFGLPVAILRPFNTFGPRQSARAIIPTIISQALTRARSSGWGAWTPGGDLTYVKDTVAGFVAIAGCDAAIGRVVNIGRGDDVSIGELVERIAARLGRPIRVETDPQRVRPAASEVGRLLAGTALARELMGLGAAATRSTRGSTRRSTGSATTSTASASDEYTT